MTYKQNKNLIPKHGGYKSLQSFKNATIVYDLTALFCKQNTKKLGYKLIEQMTGAARSGKQNIAEGSSVSATSKKSEIKLVGVARGSFEELLNDFEDFLRQNNFTLWGKDTYKAKQVRQLAYNENRSYKTYMPYLKNNEDFANTVICLIHQTSYLLDKQLGALEKALIEQGGFTENLYKIRKNYRGY